MTFGSVPIDDLATIGRRSQRSVLPLTVGRCALESWPWPIVTIGPAPLTWARAMTRAQTTASATIGTAWRPPRPRPAPPRQWIAHPPWHRIGWAAVQPQLRTQTDPHL